MPLIDPIDYGATRYELRQRMKQADISKNAMAEMLMVSKDTVGTWMYGRGKDSETLPTEPCFFYISEILGCTVNDIMVKKK